MTVRAAEEAPVGLGPHRPQALLFSFLGSLVLDRDLPALPAAVFLRVLGGLGVTEAAARATLSRMTRKGLLVRLQTGRTAHFTLSAAAEELLRQGSRRVSALEPFGHPEGQWTLLSYSMPESRRDLRHQVRAALTWAGFGGLRDGLWIAPGTVDVAAVLSGAHLAEVAGLADCFSAAPSPGTDVGAFIRRAWPVDRLRERHEAFIEAWSEASEEGDPMVRRTLLGADWLQVLRADPGLPAEHLSPDWPAARSAAVYRRAVARIEPAAMHELDGELCPPGSWQAG